ncbi:MAG: glycosyltransferase family 1 protein [Desulfomicrobium apsheronum]|nr:glycosyltransferase family 1 protein [Desulfomicrobium apsheronum]
MKTWIFYPPLKAMSGGCMVLLQIARQLHVLGRLGGTLYWDEPPGGGECAGLPWVRASTADMAAGDTYVVPEGWPNALVPGLKRGCRTLVYCQNWSYLFHGLEAGVHWRDLPVEFLAVSDPVAWHMEQVLGRRPQVIRPALDMAFFHPPASKPGGLMRIGFMPRKNKALAEQIRRIFEERNPRVKVEWVPIHGLDRLGVAEALRSCHVFLVTGFPEGCPLPPLEAMACGCLCVGFTGFGGWDYMRQVEPDGYAPHGYAPRDVPWGGNGWWFADGDVLGAALGLERAVQALSLNLDIPARMARTVGAYGSDAQKCEIVAALSESANNGHTIR